MIEGHIKNRNEGNIEKGWLEGSCTN